MDPGSRTGFDVGLSGPQREAYDRAYGIDPAQETHFFQGPYDPWSPYGAAEEGYFPVFVRPGGAGYAARGPRGYRRSDERIREDVSERLAASPEVDVSDVTVDVDDGLVRLEGFVPEPYMRRAIAYLAETVPGVRDVSNGIRVRRQDASVP